MRWFLVCAVFLLVAQACGETRICAKANACVNGDDAQGMDGALADGRGRDAASPEGDTGDAVASRDAEAVDAVPIVDSNLGSEVRIRIHYPTAGVSKMTLRGNGAGLAWDLGSPTSRGSDVFEWAGRSTASFEFKPMVEDTTWAVGANYVAKPNQELDIYPYFQPSIGTVTDATMHSLTLGEDRSVSIYLPPGYDENTTRTYPLLVMQDGHNLFDSASAAFGVEWTVDETLAEGAASSEVEEVVVIGVIPRDRLAEYTPTADPQYGGGEAPSYHGMLVADLLPWARQQYRVRSDPESTAIGGSSLGGLLSTYVVWNDSAHFGAGMAMSSSYWWDGRSLLESIRASPEMPPIRVWVDSGDSGESMDGLANTLEMYQILLGHGYRDGVDLWHYRGHGQSHNEAAWALRFPLAVRALFPGRALRNP